MRTLLAIIYLIPMQSIFKTVHARSIVQSGDVMPVEITNSKATSKAKKNGHTKPKSPITPLDQPGRLRVANWLALLGVCHSTFVNGVKSGRYPKSDGRDGRFPFWNNETARKYLTGEMAGSDEK
jgi:hypothetical protein